KSTRNPVALPGCVPRSPTQLACGLSDHTQAAWGYGKGESVGSWLRGGGTGSTDGAGLAHQIAAQVAENLHTAGAPAFVIGDVPRARPQDHRDLQVVAPRIGTVQVQLHVDVGGLSCQAEPRERVVVRRLIGGVPAAEADADAAGYALDQFAADVLHEAFQLVGRDLFRHPRLEIVDLRQGVVGENRGRRGRAVADRRRRENLVVENLGGRVLLQ